MHRHTPPNSYDLTALKKEQYKINNNLSNINIPNNVIRIVDNAFRYCHLHSICLHVNIL